MILHTLLWSYCLLYTQMKNLSHEMITHFMSGG